jgi:hypothetical protein
MPSIDINFLNELHEDYKNYNCFIETGTFMGETIFTMENYFNILYTIEFSEKYYNISKNNYNKNKNKINFIQGDSSIIFNSLLPTINEKSIFFLDGHWSSGDTGKSSKDCPLIEELTQINNLFIHEAIIIIDDSRLFGTKRNEDWSEITESNLLNIINIRLNKYHYLNSSICKNDRLVIYLNKK